MSTLNPESLERGELAYFPQSPFDLPRGDDLKFLLSQRAGGLGRKHVSYNPENNALTGVVRSSEEQIARLQTMMRSFSLRVTEWLEAELPHYRGGIEPDRATFRPDEEATRRLRPHARNDLLHVDAFPGRPARGRRILRVYVNVHPTEPRIWVTSDPLSRLLDRYRERVQRSNAGWFHEWGAKLRSLFQKQRLSASDVFMLRLHDHLKSDFDIQSRGPRRLWRFPPGSTWVAMTDACTHAELRGQFALEHSYFVTSEVLVRPELAPASLFRAA